MRSALIEKNIESQLRNDLAPAETRLSPTWDTIESHVRHERDPRGITTRPTWGKNETHMGHVIMDAHSRKTGCFNGISIIVYRVNRTK